MTVQNQLLVPRRSTRRGSGFGYRRNWRAAQHYEVDLSPLFLGILNKQPWARIPPLNRFRSYARLTLICIRLCKYSHERMQASKDEFLSVIQVTGDFVPIMEHDGPFFDPRFYRANKEERLPADARRLLQKDPRLRAEKDNKYLHMVLRSIKAFSEYPTKMQKQLCKVGWYEAFEAQRAIVRQGHPPHAFYFILSGSVVVTTFDPSSGGTKFLVSLHRGMSFGELAVITRKRRQATVSTATATEFLCISAKDFEEIFMSGGVKSVTDPDQNSFIRSIPFLKYWPIECLSSNPQACMFHYFSRGQVIVRDSNQAEWIYIVKSGSLSVLKKLVEVHPRDQKKETGAESDDETDASKSLMKNFGTWDHRLHPRKTPRERTEERQVYRNNIEMEKRLESTLPGYYNSRDRLGLIDYDEIIQDHKKRVLLNPRKASVDTGLPHFSVETAPEPVPLPQPAVPATDSESTAGEDTSVKLPKIRRTSKGAYLASKPSKRKVSKKEQIQEELFQKQIEYDKRLNEERRTTVGRKTITNELDNKPIKDLKLTEADIRPMFVQVQVLERGQYFGLTKTVFPEQATNVSVISNGAECIMINKKFFLEKASETTMHHLRQVETLLPGDEELQNGLQDYVDWKAHRAKIYNRLIRDKELRNSLKRQFPPLYGGQYCFRTGPV